MTILVVEDDDEKAKDLHKFLAENYEVDSIVTAKSFQSGLREGLTGRFNLILLDMTMKNFDRTLEDEGGRPHHFAGREIMRQLQRENVVTPIIVVTYFDRFGEEAEEVTLSELKAELRRRFSSYIDTVHYRSNVDDWKIQLREYIGSRLPRKSL
jgi:DNA-binding response OmpR family regulator